MSWDWIVRCAAAGLIILSVIGYLRAVWRDQKSRAWERAARKDRML
jgi:hypothetical protein